MIVLADLGLAALAAYGLDQIMRDRRHLGSIPTWVALGALLAAAIFIVAGLPQARVLPPPAHAPRTAHSIAIAAALLALSGFLIAVTQRWPWMGWFFPLLLAVDLLGLGSKVEIEHGNPTLGFDHPGVVAFLRQDPSLFRVDDAAEAWQPDAALMHGLYDIAGVYNPLGLAPYQAYRWAVGDRGAPLYNLLGVKYVLADSGTPPGDERLVLVHDVAPDIDVYLNSAALPRALFATCQQVVSDHEEAWRAIHSPTFDPTRTVVLEQKQLRDAVGPTDCASPPRGSHISFIYYGVNTVELSVKSLVAGWLVLSDVYYPGWRAEIDGTRTPVLRADYTFRAVRVPAGDHHIEMTFAPWTWHAGLALSLSTWLGLTVAAALKLRSLRRTSSPHR
jgi:hypothetical protein